MQLSTMLIFMALAIFVNAITYVGVTLAYFNDKHRADPPKRVAASEPISTQVRSLPMRAAEAGTPERLAS